MAAHDTYESRQRNISKHDNVGIILFYRFHRQLDEKMRFIDTRQNKLTYGYSCDPSVAHTTISYKLVTTSRDLLVSNCKITF